MAGYLLSPILLCIAVMICVPGASQAELVRFEIVEAEEAAKRLAEKRLLLGDDVKLHVELARKRDIGIE